MELKVCCYEQVSPFPFIVLAQYWIIESDENLYAKYSYEVVR